MARLMSSTELHARMESDNEFVLVDVLSPEDYNEEHIPGAINIPLEKLKDVASLQLNKNQRIIVYADDHTTEKSNQAALVLEGMGYRKVSDFDGGLHAWKQAGFETALP